MEYKTQQKNLLISFLKENSQRAFSIDDIAAQIPVGKSTIYRIISKLSENGPVRKFANDNSRGYLYQYMDCDKCNRHLHMKCTDCGKVFHMNDTASERILKNIMQNNNFSVDNTQTILVGKCSDCNKIS